jgi:putative hydrolase of the HAD superfamily
MLAILFDLDDTLVVGRAAAVAALEAVAAFAESEAGVDGARLRAALPVEAGEVWSLGPQYRYCASIGLSPWEGLWCAFEGDDRVSRDLTRWAPVYRREAWSRALALQGPVDRAFPETLARLYVSERRERHQAFDDARPALDMLRVRYALGLVTNGVAYVQREKLVATGLDGYFQAVVVSSDLGAAKPDPAIFRRALSDLDVGLSEAAMVGDNLSRDAKGSAAVGMTAFWLNRRRRPASDTDGVHEINDLLSLPAAIEVVEER